MKRHSRPKKLQQRNRPTPRSGQQTSLQWYVCEAEIAPGLERIAREEIERCFGRRVKLSSASGVRSTSGTVRFDYRGDLRALLDLQTVQAVYLVVHMLVPRPRALLGDQHFRRLVAQIELVRTLHHPHAFQTLYIGAAGSDSAVMARLKDELARHTRLAVAGHEGDLLLRLRRPLYHKEGWEVLLRLSPRPLATRAWRVCNYGGALNATVAHAMALLTEPQPQDVFLNIACGSGALLIERLRYGTAKAVIGCDIDPDALACSRANIEASGYADRIALHAWDARQLPLPDRSVDALCADLPFGHLVGSHEANLSLYPAILEEAARVAKPGLRFAVISHEVRLLTALLERSPHWTVDEVLPITLGGLHPRIFVLRKI